MEFTHFIAFNLALLAAWIVPGPAMLFAMRMSLTDGRRAGIATGVGLAAMAATWTALALLGLNAVFALVPWAYAVLKIGGGLYLVWIAWLTWRDARAPLKAAPRPTHRAFLSGVMINLANPKSVLFSAAVLVVVFPPDITLTTKLLTVANHFAIECLAYGALAIVFSHSRIGAGYARIKPVTDRIAATCLGALGLRLALDRS